MLISISMLSLSSVSVRSSSTQQSQLEAEANAKLALMMAVSKLQESMGPDQRVSYSASILDEKIDTVDMDNVNQPHWVGYRDTRVGDKEMIYRDDPKGGLFDRRTGEEWDTPVWKEEKTAQWLVSGGDNDTAVTPVDFDSTKDAIKLVDSLNGKRVEVSVPEVKLPDGSYAFWVGDEGQKVRLNQKKIVDDKLAFAGVVRGKEHMLQSGVSFNEQDKEKAISLDMLELVNGNTLETEDYFHDVTSQNQFLLTDTLRGNLKQDLSVFLEKGDQIDLPGGGSDGSQALAFGLKGSDRMVGFRNEAEAQAYGVNWDSETHHKFQSPRWDILRSWVDLGETNVGETTVLDTQISKRFKEYDDDGVVSQQYDLDNQKVAELRPILVESSIYTNLTHQLAAGKYKLRLHIYPRVVLWNPYNVTIKATPYLIHNRFIGTQKMTIRMTDGTTKDAVFHLPNFSPTLSFGGNSRKGCMLFSLEPVDIEPGECLVFSQAAGGSKPYDVATPNKNVLSAKKAPGTSNFYLDDAVSDDANVAGVFESKPVSFKFNTSSSEDYMMLLLGYPDNNYNANASYGDMRENFTLLQTAQCSYKAGAYGNLHGRWNDAVEPPIESTGVGETALPHYKTREGYRLRWFDEQQSNKELGAIQYKRHLQVSHIANANLRAQLHCRTPRSLLTWTEPELYGNYTRDMWNGDVGWGNLEPVPLANGKFGGNPFASSQEWSAEKYVLFDVPKKGDKLLSLGRLQHAPISAFGWHPTYVIGNSFPDSRSPLKHTSYAYEDRGGWATAHLHDGYIQALFQRWLQRDPRSKDTEVDQLLYDCSYEVNNAVWDRYFLSGENEATKKSLVDTDAQYLAGGHLAIQGAVDKTLLKEGLVDFHKSAFFLAKEGGFNVNSTSVDAWKALLASNRERDVAGQGNPELTPFYRVNTASENANGKASDDSETWNGYRALTDPEIDLLAQEIVKQVKLRGPFVSVSDFVNRRLSDDPRVRYGVIQQAIENTGLNDVFNDMQIDQAEIKPNGTVRGVQKQELKAKHSAAGAPGYLMQGDILQSLSPSLFARSDTFKVRAYGSSKDTSGKILAEVYCEAIVQRVARPINPDASGINPVKDDPWGRKFEIVSFRWMNKNEL